MGHWVAPKKSHMTLVAGIVGLVLGMLGLLAFFAVYSYRFSR
jgi:uncharacterized membrane protein YbaN (DUF454 family)